MKEETKWQGLLNTILGHKFGQDIEITNVRIEGREVIFKTSSDAYARLQKALNKPAILKESVAHAWPIKGANKEHASSSAGSSKTQKAEITLPKSAKEVIDTLLNEEFQKFVGVHELDFQDTRPGISSWKIGEEPKTKPLEKALQEVQLREKIVKIDFLRNAFKDMGKLCKIILGEENLIESSEGQRSFISEEVLKVEESQNNTEAIVQFNWGRVLEEVSAHPKMHGASPVISAKTFSDGEYSINMDALAYFIPEHLGPLLFHQTSNTHGVVYGTKGEDNLEELNKEREEDIDPTIFHLLIDHSESLANEFEEYIEKIQTSIDSLIANCGNNWEIRITGFGSSIDETSKFNSKENSAEDVRAFIKSISCDGRTALHDAILTALPSDEDVNIILYTDGLENESKVQDQAKIVEKLASIRDANPDFSMTSIGYGSNYDEKFFEKVARANGFHHADIRNLSELEALKGHFLNLNGSKALFEFVHELLTLKLKMQTIEGEVTATENVPVGATVKHAGEELKFTTEVGVVAEENQRLFNAKIEAMKAKAKEEYEDFAKITAKEAQDSYDTKSAAEDARIDEAIRTLSKEELQKALSVLDPSQADASSAVDLQTTNTENGNTGTSEEGASHDKPLGNTPNDGGTCTIL